MLDQFYESAETRQCKMVFPGTLNANDTLFGGELMKWMDEVAFITATRATRQRMFTAKVDKIEFLKAVPCNSIVEVVGRIKEAGPVRLMVEVTVYSEGLYDPDKQVAAKASFTMTALNERNQVVRLAVPAVG